MKKVTAVLALIFFLVFPTFAQDEYSVRHLLKRTIYFAHGKGTVESANYWSLPLGNFDFTVNRDYPGEGVVTVSGSANLSFLSSGYIEGAGYGDRGKITVKADFCVEKDGKLEPVTLEDIDFIFYGGTKVKLKDGEIQDLFLMIEEPTNRVSAKGTSIMVYRFDKKWGELKHSKDIDRIVGFSFTKEGAKRAYKSALAAN